MKLSSTDPRPKLVRDQIALGDLQKFSDLFTIIPKTLVANAVGINHNRMSRLILQPEDIVFRDLKKMSQVFKLPLHILSTLTVNEILINAGESPIKLKGIYQKKATAPLNMAFLTTNKE
jgi:hypothetical protein